MNKIRRQCKPLDQDYPAIVQHAKAEGSKIQWDEKQGCATMMYTAVVTPVLFFGHFSAFSKYSSSSEVIREALLT